MVNKIIILIFVILSSAFKSQIDVNIKLVNKKEIWITIKNITNRKIAFPLNKDGLAPQLINLGDPTDKYITSLPIVSLIKEGELVEAVKSFIQIDINSMKYIKREKNKERLFTDIVLLKPDQEYSYLLFFNSDKFYDLQSKAFYWSFLTSSKTAYKMFIEFNIDKDFYGKAKQIKKNNKEYCFFIGNIKSNTIEYITD